MRLVHAVWMMLAALPVYGGPQGQRRDVLLVEHPEKLTVLNHYEQTASRDDRKTLRPFSPCVVLKDHATLSDGYTSCVDVECGGSQFSLLRGDDGELPQQAGLHLLRGTTWIGDTMRVKGKSLLPMEGAAGDRRRVAPGSLVERFFEYRGRVYIHPLDSPETFGWIGRDEQRLLGALQEATRHVAGSDTSIEAIVRVKIDETNSVLRQLYQMFNGQTGRHLLTPQWTVSARPGLLQCSLHDSRISYDQSSRYLDNDMENALIGTGARLVESPGSIAVYLP